MAYCIHFLPGEVSPRSQWYNPAVMANPSLANWDRFIAAHPEAHLLQTSVWGALKSGFGWSVDAVQIPEAGALILFRPLPLGFSLAYIPKGPIGKWLPDLLPKIDAICKKHRAFMLKIEPDSTEDPVLAESFRSHGFVASPQSVQPRRTLIVDLQGTEDEVMARMHQKTRYNIRLAMRKGVSVRAWDDLESFTRMMNETSRRNKFGVHSLTYYHRTYELFHPQNACELLVAEVEDQPLASLMVFARGNRAWYFYGASTNQQRNLMPTYLLQWEAMRWARGRGCTSYDLWGIPDAGREILEGQFTTRNDGLWGIYRFKRGFGGDLVRTIGSWDRPYNRPISNLYGWLIRQRGRLSQLSPGRSTD